MAQSDLPKKRNPIAKAVSRLRPKVVPDKKKDRRGPRETEWDD